MKKTLITMAFFQLSCIAFGQDIVDRKLEKDYRKNPRWIAMMSDTLSSVRSRIGQPLQTWSFSQMSRMNMFIKKKVLNAFIGIDSVF